MPDSAKRVELQNSDQLDHLVGCQDKDELAIIGARSLTSAAELALLKRRGWIGHGEVADLLGRPSAIGVRSHPQQVHRPGGHFQYEEHVDSLERDRAVH
ncbi:MAG: hypothetical protein QOJ06_3001, partial [Pseudonocardiales bacterium]|nr:hypothetical protein [Pseudonocardiales bacterium]